MNQKFRSHLFHVIFESFCTTCESKMRDHVVQILVQLFKQDDGLLIVKIKATDGLNKKRDEDEYQKTPVLRYKTTNYDVLC